MKGAIPLLGLAALGAVGLALAMRDEPTPTDDAPVFAPGEVSPGWPAIPEGESLSALPPDLLAMFTSALYSTDPDAIAEVAEELAAAGYTVHAGILDEMAAVLEQGGTASPPAPDDPPTGDEIDPWTALGQSVAGMTPAEALAVLTAMQEGTPDQLDALAADLRAQGYEAAAVLLEARSDELASRTFEDVSLGSVHLTAGDPGPGIDWAIALPGETPGEYVSRMGATWAAV